MRFPVETTIKFFSSYNGQPITRFQLQQEHLWKGIHWEIWGDELSLVSNTNMGTLWTFLICNTEELPSLKRPRTPDSTSPPQKKVRTKKPEPDPLEGTLQEYDSNSGDEVFYDDGPVLIEDEPEKRECLYLNLKQTIDSWWGKDLQTVNISKTLLPG